MTAIMRVPPPAQYHYGERTYDSLQTILDDPSDLLLSSSASIGRPSDGVLDILSASLYPQDLMQSHRDSNHIASGNHGVAKASTQLYGGIALDGSHSDGSNSASAEKEQSRPTRKKRASKHMTASDDHDDQPDNKKQRGRPRLDTQDETAADRRRTQIRLAQRAYRHRKETTISALKHKVSTLQDTIDQMNKTFLDLHDNMVDAGVLTSHYALGQQLQAATEEFTMLAKITSADSDDEDEKIAKLTQGESEVALDMIQERDVGKWSGRERKSRQSRTSNKTGTSRPRGTSFERSSSEAEAELPVMPTSTSSNGHESILAAISQTSYIDVSNLTGLNDLMQFNAQIPDINPTFTYADLTEKSSISRPLKAPNQPQGSYTYSFQETSFSRRLHRMTLERAFRNLTNPAIDPEYIKRAFRFTFCFSNRKRMIQRFQEMLKRRAGESLENWSVPFFNIGGAGTHFPRRDEVGKNIYPPNMVSAAKAFGPQLWSQPETPRTEASTKEMLEAIGFGGEWFDSHDVEEYLKTKGIFVDGQSSFVEVDPSILLLLKPSSDSTSPLAAGSASLSDASSSTRSPYEQVLRTPSPFVEGYGESMTDPFVARDISDMYNYSPQAFGQPETENDNNNTSNNNAWSDPNSSDLHGASQLSTQAKGQPFQDILARRYGPLTFDVELFLETMVNQSACLGRAPGFRKDAIDEALRLSVQESY